MREAGDGRGGMRERGDERWEEVMRERGDERGEGVIRDGSEKTGRDDERGG